MLDLGRAGADLLSLAGGAKALSPAVEDAEWLRGVKALHVPAGRGPGCILKNLIKARL